MRKRKAIEHRWSLSEETVGDIDNIVALSLEGLEIIEDEYPLDPVDLQNLIHFLSADEITVLLLRHLGYKSKEIWKIMGLPNINKYYKFNHSLNMHIYLFKTFSNNAENNKN